MSKNIIEHYHNSAERLLLFDYDGTLAEFASTPAEAVPSEALLSLLSSLAADSANTVVIISGRDGPTLEAWLGHLPLHFVAEHGHFTKAPGQPWHSDPHLDLSWKQPVRRLMESIHLDGSWIEEKSAALVWHYFNSDPDQGLLAAEGLSQELLNLNLPIKIIAGHRVVEVSAPGANKGTAARDWLAKGEYDFILGAGDDTTDEDLFHALPATAHKLKIGSHWPDGQAAFATPAELREFLAELVSSGITGK
jgi:trehalose 6-phosphate synthase/phosphatase